MSLKIKIGKILQKFELLSEKYKKILSVISVPITDNATETPSKEAQPIRHIRHIWRIYPSLIDGIPSLTDYRYPFRGTDDAFSFCVFEIFADLLFHQTEIIGNAPDPRGDLFGG